MKLIVPELTPTKVEKILQAKVLFLDEQKKASMMRGSKNGLGLEPELENALLTRNSSSKREVELMDH